MSDINKRVHAIKLASIELMKMCSKLDTELRKSGGTIRLGEFSVVFKDNDRIDDLESFDAALEVGRSSNDNFHILRHDARIAIVMDGKLYKLDE